MIAPINLWYYYFQLASVQSITTSLLNFISQIGRIESINLQSDSASTCGYILFHQPEHAAQLLRQQNLNFAKTNVRIWEAIGQPTHGTNILDINGHCLQKVFFYLGVGDLASVAEVNQWFKTNAQTVFPLKYKSFEYKVLPEAGSEIILKNFGHFIEKLDIDLNRQIESSPNYTAQLKLIAPHCSRTLDKLMLANVELRDAVLEKFEPVFAHLRVFRLDNCEFSDEFIEMLRCSNELKTFAIIFSYGSRAIPCFNVPKLETVFLSFTGGCGTNHLELFLESNPQLKNIMIQYSQDDIFSKIAKLVPLVETFQVESYCTFNTFVQPSFDQSAFSSLKKLSINIPGESSASIISALGTAQVQLEHLEVHAATGHLYDAICNIKTIKTLYLFDAHELKISQLYRICRSLGDLADLLLMHSGPKYHADDLMTIARYATKLERINFWRNWIDISAATYASLVKILEERVVQTRLEVIINQGSYGVVELYEQTHQNLLVITDDLFKYRPFDGFWPKLLD